jgi:hypothetical protein
MPVRVVRCPNDHSIRVPEEAAGKKVKCRECGAVFVIPAAKPSAKPTAKAPAPSASGSPGKGPAKRPAPKPSPISARKPAAPAKRRARDEDDDEEEELPRKRRRGADDEDDDETPLTPEQRRKERLQDRRERLKHVNLGLLLHTIKMWASVVLIFAVILVVIFGVITATMDTYATSTDKTLQAMVDLSDSARSNFRMMLSVFTIFSIICIVAAPLVGTVGSGFCLLIPKKSGASGTILTSFIFDVIPLVGLVFVLLGVLNVFGFEKEKNLRFVEYLLAGCGFFTMTALLLFMVFLRQLSAYLSKPLLGSDALNLVMYLIIQFVTFPLVMIVNGYAFKFALGALGVGSVGGMGVMFLVSIGWFAQFYYLFFVPMLRLLGNIRETIEPRREKEDEEEEEDDEDEEDDD